MVLELPELARENQDWKIYRAHILDSAAAEGVVSHLSGATPKPVDSRQLEAWNVSNAVAKYIILEVITDSLLERLVHHELPHTLFSHLAAIFGNHEPIAIEPPAEWNHQDEPLREDSHPKSDGAYSAHTAEIPDTPPYAPNGLSSADRSQETEQSRWERNAHDPDRDEDLSSQPFELKMTEFHDEKPSGTTPAGIPSIHNTNSTLSYPKAPGDLLNAPDGMSRGDIQEMAESEGQWQRTAHEVTRNDAMASPAPNLADRTSEMTTGDGPIPFSRTRPINAVKHQHMSTRYKPLPNGCANANAQHSNGHPKPIIHLPRRHRPPLEGESVGGAANGCTHSSSGQPMPQKPAASPNELVTLVTTSIKLESPRSIGISHVRLGGASWRADDPNGPGNQTDGSHGQVDEPRGSADALDASYNAETAILGHGDSLGTYLRPGDAKRGVRETDGVGSHVDTWTWSTDISSVETNMLVPTIAPETVSTRPTVPKPQDLPSRSAKWLPDEPNSCGNPPETSSTRTGSQNVETDVETTRDEAETINMRLIESKPPKSPTKGTNGCANETDGSSHHPGTLNMRTHAIAPADEAGNIRTHQNKQKRPNSPAGSATSHSEDPNAFRNHADMSGTRTDGHSVTNDTKPAENALKNVRKRQMDSKMQNSPYAPENGTPKSTYRRRKVSAGSIDVYIPLNASIMPQSRNFVFGQVEGGDGVMVVRELEERVGNGDGNRNGGDSDVNSTTSSISTDSMRVNTAQLAAESQQMRSSQKSRIHDLPVLSIPPIQPTNYAECLYGPARRQRRRGTLKIERLNDKKSANPQTIETAHLECASTAQPHRKASNRAHRVNRPSRRRGRLKVNTTKVSQALEVEMTHLWHTRIAQPPIQHAERPYGDVGHIQQCGTLEIKRINVSQTRNGGNAHLAHAHTAQPHGSPQSAPTGSSDPNVDVDG